MTDVVARADIAAAVLLMVVSFISLLAGTVLRRWPDKVQAYTADLDGFALFLTPEAHRVHIAYSGWLLLVMSFVALVAAAAVL
jgi:hypothetical protein